MNLSTKQKQTQRIEFTQRIAAKSRGGGGRDGQGLTGVWGLADANYYI